MLPFVWAIAVWGCRAQGYCSDASTREACRLTGEPTRDARFVRCEWYLERCAATNQNATACPLDDDDEPLFHTPL